MLWKQAAFSNLRFRSKIWKLHGFVACKFWWSIALCLHQRFWQIYVSQNNKKNKNKKYFCKSCLQCFSRKNVLAEHIEVCLSIGTIEFKNYFTQIPVPFKIYVDFECNLKSVESCEGFYSKKISRSSSL